MKAKVRTPDITGSVEFIQASLNRRRRSSDAPLTIDDVSHLLRRVCRLWDKPGTPVHERRALADVMVRAPLAVLDVTGRYVEIKRKWSALSASRCTCLNRTLPSEAESLRSRPRASEALPARGGGAPRGVKKVSLRSDAQRPAATARAARRPPDDRSDRPDRSWTVPRVYPRQRWPRGVLPSVRRGRQRIQ